MGGLKVKIHPLFLVFGVYYGVTGRISVFLIYTVVAVVHELGHSFLSASMGYRLNKITLMPFGAVVSGNIDGLKTKDELKIALAGPLCNLAIGLFFVALWWLFPETYAFTDIAAEANFSMAALNMIPVFPLDGGRVAASLLTKKFGKSKAYKICKIAGVTLSVVFFATFITTLFYTPNYSILFFGLFVLFGAFDKSNGDKYVKVYSAITTPRLKRGIVYRKIAVDKSVTVKKFLSMLDAESVNEAVIYDSETPLKLLTQKDINAIIEKGDLYAPLSAYSGENNCFSNENRGGKARSLGEQIIQSKNLSDGKLNPSDLNPPDKKLSPRGKKLSLSDGKVNSEEEKADLSEENEVVWGERLNPHGKIFNKFR